MEVLKEIPTGHNGRPMEVANRQVEEAVLNEIDENPTTIRFNVSSFSSGNDQFLIWFSGQQIVLQLLIKRLNFVLLKVCKV
ncbi:hypothetical protein QE152_g21777 [Popillia japonica]|uniref:Uncharacterized protein n=1 Tax=Popillia japonica TaxID=7064 RepID=A0AAW1KN20_POPJA